MKATYVFGRMGTAAGLLSLVFACAFLAVLPAKASDMVFNVNATIGQIEVSGNTGIYTGDTFTGTVTIDPTTGIGDAANLTIDVSVNGKNAPALGAFNEVSTTSGGTCSSPNCEFVIYSTFLDYADVLLGNTMGYTGGNLLSTSDITAGTVLYHLTGTVTPATPEPSSLILSLSGFAGLGLASLRRRLLPTR